MKTFAAAHPELGHFGGWAQSAPWTGSYAEEPYNSLNSFVFTSATGAAHVVRWSLLPSAQPVPVPPDELAKRAPDFLEHDLVSLGPVRERPLQQFASGIGRLDCDWWRVHGVDRGIACARVAEK